VAHCEQPAEVLDVLLHRAGDERALHVEHRHRRVLLQHRREAHEARHLQVAVGEVQPLQRVVHLQQLGELHASLVAQLVAAQAQLAQRAVLLQPLEDLLARRGSERVAR